MMLQNRGPDQNNAVEIERNDCSLLFYGCVLHMRGSSLALQPSISKCGNILLFNGEVFSGLEVRILICFAFQFIFFFMLLIS